jgi:transposase
LERLPAYVPEFNPVEYIWSYWKKHELPNFCPKDYPTVKHYGRQALSRMRRRKPLIAAFKPNCISKCLYERKVR